MSRKAFGRGYFLSVMPKEPAVKRTFIFVDGQNLFYAAKEAFGFSYPNYDINLLSRLVCEKRGWEFHRAHFYTGIPPEWHKHHAFWKNKLAAMGNRVGIVTRPLRSRIKTVRLPDGAEYSYSVFEEKGIDVRIALDVVHAAKGDDCDVAVLFTQDQDLAEAAEEVKEIARQRDKWFKIACAFPLGETSRNRRGVNNTDWIHLSRSDYESCIDPRDYRPRKSANQN